MSAAAGWGCRFSSLCARLYEGNGTEFNSDVETSWLVWEVSCSWTGGVAGVGVVVELGPGLGQTGRV